MKVLFDTHALLWYLAGDEQLPKVWRTFADGKRPKKQPAELEGKYFSVASYWEIAIKINLGKLRLSRPFHTLPMEITARDFIWLPVQPSHCHEAAVLPLHHRDPFDRMLVAQARLEGMNLLTMDARMRAYGIECVW